MKNWIAVLTEHDVEGPLYGSAVIEFWWAEKEKVYQNEKELQIHPSPYFHTEAIEREEKLEKRTPSFRLFPHDMDFPKVASFFPA